MPIDTIIIDVRLTPLRRRGCQTARSARKPAAAAANMPIGAATRMCKPTLWFIHQATIAPSVTSSPWAKLDRPVVP